MNIPYLKFKIKKSTEEEIFSHLKKCKNDFNPPLDSKVNIREYSIKLFDNAITFEAWIGNILIGLVAAYFNDMENHSGYITNVSLTKEYIGRGIASKLLSMCINYGKQHNFKKIHLEVLKGNSKAILLYQRHGFIEFDEKDNFMLMKLELANY